MARKKTKGASIVRRIVSIPNDVVLSPQSELPRHVVGIDRSNNARSGGVRELTWAQFDRLVQALARDIGKVFRPTAVVGVAHGGVFVGGAIAGALGCDFYPVRISRRSRDKVVRRSPRMFGRMPAELKNQTVLVVDDIAASGETLKLARELAGKVGAKAVKTASLVARAHGFKPNWQALQTDEVVVFPWDYESVTEDERFDVEPDKAGA